MSAVCVFPVFLVHFFSSCDLVVDRRTSLVASSFVRKMIIPLKIDRGEGVAGEEPQGRKDEQERNKGVCVPEWSMVELQGELISKEALSGQSLGSMTFENVSGAAVPWLLMRLQGWCESKQSNVTSWNDITLDRNVKDGVVINTTTKMSLYFRPGWYAR